MLYCEVYRVSSVVQTTCHFLLKPQSFLQSDMWENSVGPEATSLSFPCRSCWPNKQP